MAMKTLVAGAVICTALLSALSASADKQREKDVLATAAAAGPTTNATNVMVRMGQRGVRATFPQLRTPIGLRLSIAPTLLGVRGFSPAASSMGAR